jgi:hypothetical protein
MYAALIPRRATACWHVGRAPSVRKTLVPEATLRSASRRVPFQARYAVDAPDILSSTKPSGLLRA